MGISVEIGDVFLISLDSNSWALGQLVSNWQGELYVAVFENLVKTQDIDPNIVLKMQPTLLALTLDAKIFNGEWPIIGNVQENICRFPQPAYKVRQSGVLHIESRDRTFSRPATTLEANILRYRSVSSPAVIEKAVRTHFGFGKPSLHYDEFDADYAMQSSRLIAA